MNPEIKQKWIDALWLATLESGEYLQGKQMLKREINGEVRYCCLGVLCEVAIKNGLELEVQEATYEPWNNNGTLPDRVVKWAGLKDAYGNVTSNGSESLIELNDSKNYDFKQIAQVIREHF
jgi:hypothetical protein